jgi:DNA-binding response OmpR family regulator
MVDLAVRRPFARSLGEIEPNQDMPMTPHSSRMANAGRVLIVEDEWVLAASAEAALEDANYTVVGIAVSADEAVRLAGAERPDLVLMDIRLRGMRNGIDAAREIRERFGIRSLFVTANSDPETQRQGGMADPAGWLQKPVSGEDLVASVVACLGRSN